MEEKLTEEDVIRYLEECNESQDILGFCYIPEMVCSKILDLYQKEKEKNKKVIDYIEKNKEKFKILDYAYPEAVINHFNKINKILKGE